MVVPGQGELGRRLETLGAGVIAADYGWWCASEPLTESEVERRLADDLTRFLAYCLPEIEATGAEVICSNSIVSPYGAIAATVLELPHIWFLHEFGSEAAGYRFFLPFPEVLQFVESFSDFLFGATLSLPRTLFGQLDEACYDSLYPFIRPPQTVDEAVPPAATAETSPPLRLIDLASINPAKQQETDLRAVAILQERGHQVELVLQGPQDSEYVAMLRELGRSLEIADRLHIRPYSEEVWSSLSAADVVVISGPTHVFGRAAAEGMLSRLPVVYPLGTRGPPNKELLQSALAVRNLW